VGAEAVAPPRLLWLEQAFGLFEREAAKIVGRVAHRLERPQETERQQFLPRPGRSGLGPRGCLRVGRLAGRYKMAKHFALQIGEGAFSYARKAAQIAAAAALDGIYVVRTSVPKGELAAAAVVAAYKDLSRVEDAFRSLKSMDLEVRPIYQRLETFTCAPMPSSTCWPSIWSFTCAPPGRRSPAPMKRRTQRAPLPWLGRAGERRRRRRRAPRRPRTGRSATASAACLRTLPP